MDITKQLEAFDQAHPDSVNDKGEHALRDKWVLWSHAPERLNNDWSLNGYERHCVIDTIEGFWNVYNGLPSIVSNEDMWFLMRDGVPPIWEHEVNAKGGSFKFRVANEMVDNIWLTVSKFLVTENICVRERDARLISGISLSPKKHNFSTINIWSLDSSAIESSQFPTDVDGINFTLSRFHSHERRKDYKQSEFQHPRGRGGRGGRGRGRGRGRRHSTN